MSDERRTYTLTVVVEPKEEAWHAYCPTLLDYGAATWGATREEALEHIRAMVTMLVERLAEKGVPVPTAPAEQTAGPTEQVVVTIGAPAEQAMRAGGGRRQAGNTSQEPGLERHLDAQVVCQRSRN